MNDDPSEVVVLYAKVKLADGTDRYLTYFNLYYIRMTVLYSESKVLLVSGVYLEGKYKATALTLLIYIGSFTASYLIQVWTTIIS